MGTVAIQTFLKRWTASLKKKPILVAIRTGLVHRLVFAIHTGFLLN